MEEEIELLVKFLEHPAGYDLSLFNAINIRNTGIDYEVSWRNKEDTWEYKCLSNLSEAAKFFVNLRFKLKLGLDIEEKLLKK